jgi:hypothetical protein
VALSDQPKVQHASVWGNVSYGPAMLIYMCHFLVYNPVYLSMMIAVFNLISIFAVIVIGAKYFTKEIGLLAGIFLATNPWWVIFSRMIYNPTLIITIVSVAMLLTFAVIQKRQTFNVLILVTFDTATNLLLSIYFVLITVFLYLSILYHKHLFIGIFLSIVLYIPSIILQQRLFKKFFQVLVFIKQD